ncbi:MAG: hypothetical protein K6C99_02845 [Lachnospiraceae bacterium]|nr:hypothetical protein [Lachnospiraceae bacterium]
MIKMVMRKLLIVLFLVAVMLCGCGKHDDKKTAIGIGYAYVNYPEQKLELVYADGTADSCELYPEGDGMDDISYANGNYYFYNIYNSNIVRYDRDKGEMITILDKSKYKVIAPDHDGVEIGHIEPLNEDDKAAIYFKFKGNETIKGIFLIDDGELEFLCDSDSMYSFSSDKNKEHLYVRQKGKLVSFNVKDGTSEVLIDNFEPYIFDITPSADKIAYFIDKTAYIYDVKQDHEDDITDLDLPANKISISDDGKWVAFENIGAVGYIYPARDEHIYLYDCENDELHDIASGNVGTDYGGFDLQE